MVELILVALQVAFPAWSAARLAAWLCPEAGRGWHGLVAASAWCLQVFLAGLLAGGIGIATPLGMIVVLGGTCAVVGALSRQSGGAGDCGERLAPAALAALAGLGAVLIAHLAQLAIHGTEFFSDDYAYHAVVVGAWVRNASFAQPLVTMAHYYPFNPHVLGMVFAVPVSHPGWVWIPTMGWLVVLAMAFLAVGEGATDRPSLALRAAAGTAALASPNVFWMAGKMTSPDITGAIALVAAFVLARPRPGASTREQRGQICLAMLLVGFAAGSKPTFVVPGAVASAAVLWFHAGLFPWRWGTEARLRAALLVACGLLASFFWYGRNVVLAGNPLFPFEVGPFDGMIKPRHTSDSVLLAMLSGPFSGRENWIGALVSLLRWPVWLGVVALALGLAGGALVLAAGLRKRPWAKSLLDDPRAWLALALAAFLAVHVNAPYSGSTLGGDKLQVFSRYIAFVDRGLLLLGAWGLGALRKPALHAAIAAVVSVPALVIAAMDGSVPMWLGLVAGALVVFGLGFAQARPGGRLLPIALAAIVTLVVVRGTLAPVNGLTVESRYKEWRDLAPLFPAIDELPANSRIGQFTLRTWETWYLGGGRFQHEPVFLGVHGEVLPPLHVAYKTLRYGGRGEHPRFGLPRLEELDDPALLVENLRAANLDYLVFSQFSWAEPEWPPQRAPIVASGDWQLVWSDGFSEIYRPARGAAP